MAQLFRDQYRDACRAGRGTMLFALWLGVARDLAVSVFREHLTEQTNQMKNMPSQKLSLILLVAAIGAALVSCSVALSQPGVAVGLAYLSALILLARAFIEWSRPQAEWLKGIGWGVVIFVAYGFVMPVWGKVHLPANPALVMMPMFLNLLVPLINMGRHFAGRRA